MFISKNVRRYTVLNSTMRFSRLLHRRVAVTTGAGGSWFLGSSGANPSFLASARLFLVTLCGIMAFNFIFRGNVLGRCQNEDEIVLPVRGAKRASIIAPEGYGFIDGSEED